MALHNIIDRFLADPEVKRAIVELIKSHTVPQPVEEWQEIYHCQSNRMVERDDERASRAVGVPAKSMFRLYMRVYFNESGHVGKVVFLEGVDGLFSDDPNNRAWARISWAHTFSRDEDIVFINSRDRFEVIDKALDVWMYQVAKWEGELDGIRE